MKKYNNIWLILFLLLLTNLLKSQTGSSGVNYLKVETVCKEGVYTENGIDALDYTSKSTVISYYDAMGRPEQQIQYKGGANINSVVKDIVTAIVYDKLGREEIKYLPYARSSAKGAYIKGILQEQKAYYLPGQGNADHALTSAPYMQTVFDNSPLNRVLEQGAPGEVWQPFNASIPKSGHTVKMEYETNNGNDVFLFEVSNNQLVKLGYYGAYELYKTVSKDENWVSGNLHTTEEYKNKQGQVVLKRSYVIDNGIITPVETYYVYDDFGLLRYVIPPQAVKNLYTNVAFNNEVELVDQDQTLTGTSQSSTYLITKGSSITLSNFSFAASSGSSLTISAGAGNGDLIYAYKYDCRKRMIEKKIPGAAPVYMVYDNRDRLVATQDGEMREKGAWVFTKYDVLNRPIITGVLSNNLKTQYAMQAVIDDYYADNSNKYYETRDNSLSGTYCYTTSNSFPEVGIDRWLSIAYYDTYGYKDSKAFSVAHNISNATNYNSQVSGMITGTCTKVLDGSEFSSTQAQWLVSTIYYDDKGRTIQCLTDLYPKNIANEEILSTNYDFVDKVIRTKQVQSFEGNTKIIEEHFDYDHAGRLLAIYQSIDGAPDVTLAKNEYNELGELIRKYVGGTTEAGCAQVIDYSYNIRGWLTDINNIDTGISDKQKFAMRLSYLDIPYGLHTVLEDDGQYNGNIAAIEWLTQENSSSNIPSAKQGYGFDYDALNRLTNAKYGMFAMLGKMYRNSSLNNYSVNISGYDLNGNILGLSRKKGIEVTTNNFEAFEIDNLTYKYIGNQLLSVSDAASTSNKDKNGKLAKDYGFKDGASSSVEYQCDLNGNMIRDDNKGLTNVDYNYLNLPSKLTGKDNKTISYIYNANGQKLAKTADSKTTYYAGNIIYEEANIQYILNSEGKYDLSSGSGQYQFDIKDHLGNVRMVVNSSGTVLQQSSYYPFGMAYQKGGNDNKYLYNGKELQEDAIGGNILDWYDYGARFYDPSLARWSAVDPLSESYYNDSPYHFSGNNPIKFVDSNGMNYDEWNLDVETGKLTWQSDMGGDETQYVNFVSTNEDGSQVLHSTTSFEGSDIYSGPMATDYNGSFTYGVSNKDLWSDIPNEYQGHYMAWDLKLRYVYSNKQDQSQINSIRAQEALGMDRREMIWNSSDNYKYIVGKYGTDASFVMAHEYGMMPLPTGDVLASALDVLQSPAFTKNFGTMGSSFFKKIPITPSSSSTTPQSLSLSKNPWIRFLQINKGRYKGDQWLSKALKDYRNTK
ncbi:DUF6443 domain-containing protein [Plebeiibacterium sediminum]|uniref:DUF6443 domain-containing protein n=1 Tax=Plebeiibacterium sediminum TaxID=2992112 RepID=A0AAE3SGA8_9BACT|nr:DUF6443 domain-containing protein [Plebeiobacterium sediminum]MCW3787892.1 DUF6443 domain-containing protein [Plebeiobacterium sediminum]